MRREIRWTAEQIAVGSLVLLLGGSGCFQPIGVDPTCPEQMTVGETEPLVSNVTSPGFIATFQWTADPETAGTFEDANLPDTDFTAMEAGTVRLQLAAGDGLYFASDFCDVEILAN